MNTFKRITVIFFAVLLLAANLPLCACATDPVSAATMANAVAQAISAYGASQGVSMTFDVASTVGIGEGVHELWDQFKEDIQDNNVPTFDSLAITMWADIYTKVGNNVGIHINDTEMPYIDAFWNWLLSGPAEMQKVDNQYYQWTIDQSTNTVIPIGVLTSVANALPVITSYGNDVSTFSSAAQYFLEPNYQESRMFSYTSVVSTFFGYKKPGNANLVYPCVMTTSQVNGSAFKIINLFDGRYNGTQNSYFNYQSALSGSGVYVYTTNLSGNSLQSVQFFCPVYESLSDGIAAATNTLSNPDSLSVRPYIGDTVPQDVYIPNNDDVNYAPLPYVGGLDIPWDDSLFGDGTGTLTDAQSESISGVVDDAISNSLEKTLTLAETDNPSPPISEVYIPFLPVNLPNFNFSLSGIWHYVREWITSLGAWFTMVLTIWSNLPYAIVVPVYATMVILIVLGVYKRFFM